MSERALAARMKLIGRDLSGLDAVFITHEHSDHVRGIGPLARKHKAPVFTTEGTLRRIRNSAGQLPQWRPLRADEPITVGDLTVEPYATPHDAEESVAFVVWKDNAKLGHATDLGSVTPGVRQKLKNADTLLVEANHDLDMLDAGPYPWPVKQRVKGEWGHLSNESCAELLASVVHSQLKRVVLMHLSQTNNHPDIAELTARQALGDCEPEMILASQDRPTHLLPVV